jgi:hypothetical protein
MQASKKEKILNGLTKNEEALKELWMKLKLKLILIKKVLFKKQKLNIKKVSINFQDITLSLKDLKILKNK